MHYFLFSLIVVTLFANMSIIAESRTVRVIQPAPHTHPYYHGNNRHNPNFYTRTRNNPYRLNRPHYQPQSHFSDINALEKYTMNRNFRNESNLERLQRLEMQTFGAVQSGDVDSRYENVRNAILARPNPTNTKSSILRNISNYFSGQMTGYTPSFTSTPSDFTYTQYPSSFGNQSFEEFSGPIRGYHLNNYGVSSSSGVHILD